MNLLQECLKNAKHIHLVGIKGTGVCALCELLLDAGAKLSGSDINDVFYTDAILKSLNIPYYENFDEAHITDDIALVIYSAAFSPQSNVELAAAARLGIPLLSYPQALGCYSALFDSSGIAGVHGKTTTTALAGAVASALALPARVLSGSAVSSFNNHCTLNIGGRFFIAETCEYRRHFLEFNPRRIVLTSVESDHQDYYPDYVSIRSAFVEYAAKLPAGGQLIYCADDAGAVETAKIAAENFLLYQNSTPEDRGTLPPSGAGNKIDIIDYGFNAKSLWRLEYARVQSGIIAFKLAAFKREFLLKIPGMHNVLNAAAALALNYSLYFCDSAAHSEQDDDLFAEKAALALENFRGSKRRTELIGEARGVIFIDDYGHHPTAIKATLRGLKQFYPDRTLIVSFMPHTYSRTAALLNEFAGAWQDADALILHKIYASARETPLAGIDGRTLYLEVKKQHNNVLYIDEPLDALCEAQKIEAAAPAVFLTLGAGDNWKLGRALYEKLKTG
ncbi:MAG: UDP-N-acetylmuramate--L-alanine ligase [Spirochaetaceae bacterium]|jgi:UDP-N-acetylmuramate--alanine ligase|nr:UDP-N-acetylmuramate--L-alanine ligase [Spirochaetaceae bacterium]